MVLDLPEVVEAQPVGQLHLLQRVSQQPPLVTGLPGAGELVLVEDPESHGGATVCAGTEGDSKVILDDLGRPADLLLIPRCSRLRALDVASEKG
jgi:hypothetical protein